MESQPPRATTRSRSPPRLQLDLPDSSTSLKRSLAEMGFEMEQSPHSGSSSEMADHTTGSSSSDESSVSYSSSRSRNRSKRARSEDIDFSSGYSSNSSTTSRSGEASGGHLQTRNGQASLNLGPIEGVSPISNSLPWHSHFPSVVRSPLIEGEDVRMDDPPPMLPENVDISTATTPSSTGVTLRPQSFSWALPFHEPTSPSSPPAFHSHILPDNQLDPSQESTTQSYNSPSPSASIHTLGLPEQDFFGPGSLRSTTPPWLRDRFPILPIPSLSSSLSGAGSATSYHFAPSGSFLNHSSMADNDTNMIPSDLPSRSDSLSDTHPIHLNPIAAPDLNRQLPPLPTPDTLALDLSIRPTAPPPPQTFTNSPQPVSRSRPLLFQRRSSSALGLSRVSIEAPSSSLAEAIGNPPLPVGVGLGISVEAEASSDSRTESPSVPLPPAPRLGVPYRFDEMTGEWVHAQPRPSSSFLPSPVSSSFSNRLGSYGRRRRLGEFLELAPSPSPTYGMDRWARFAASVDGESSRGFDTPEPDGIPTTGRNIEPTPTLGQEQDGSYFEHAPPILRSPPSGSSFRNRRTAPLSNSGSSPPVLPPLALNVGQEPILLDDTFLNSSSNAIAPTSNPNTTLDLTLPLPSIGERLDLSFHTQSPFERRHSRQPGREAAVDTQPATGPSLSARSSFEDGNDLRDRRSSVLSRGSAHPARFLWGERLLHLRRSSSSSLHGSIGEPELELPPPRPFERRPASRRPPLTWLSDVHSVVSTTPHSPRTNQTWEQYGSRNSSSPQDSYESSPGRQEPVEQASTHHTSDSRRRPLDLDLTGFNASFDQELEGYFNTLGSVDFSEQESGDNGTSDDDVSASSTRATTSLRRPPFDDLPDNGVDDASDMHSYQSETIQARSSTSSPTSRAAPLTTTSNRRTGSQGFTYISDAGEISFPFIVRNANESPRAPSVLPDPLPRVTLPSFSSLEHHWYSTEFYPSPLTTSGTSNSRSVASAVPAPRAEATQIMQVGANLHDHAAPESESWLLDRATTLRPFSRDVGPRNESLDNSIPRSRLSQGYGVRSSPLEFTDDMHMSAIRPSPLRQGVAEPSRVESSARRSHERLRSSGHPTSGGSGERPDDQSPHNTQRDRHARLHDFLARRESRHQPPDGIPADLDVPARTSRWGDVSESISPPVRPRSAWREITPEPEARPALTTRRLALFDRHNDRPSGSRPYYHRALPRPPQDELARSFSSFQEFLQDFDRRHPVPEASFTLRPWRHMRQLSDYIRDEDFDGSYDNLVRLSDILGAVKTRATPEEVISSLPSAFYKDWADGTSEARCPICLEDYQSDDAVLRIPDCNHWFHKACLGLWLQGARSCPVCRGLVKSPATTENGGTNSSNVAGTGRRDSDFFSWTFGPVSPDLPGRPNFHWS